MLGNNIVLSPRPLGRYIEGVCSNGATFYAGMCITLVTGTAPDAGGRLTWQPWSYSTGYQGLTAITDVDWNQGFTPANPGYTTGRRFPIYIPCPGDELNMILAELIGTTGDPAITQGDELTAQTLTGKLVKAASGTAGGTNHQFVAFETLIAALGNEWVHVMKV